MKSAVLRNKGTANQRQDQLRALLLSSNASLLSSPPMKEKGSEAFEEQLYTSSIYWPLCSKGILLDVLPGPSEVLLVSQWLATSRKPATKIYFGNPFDKFATLRQIQPSTRNILRKFANSNRTEPGSKPSSLPPP